MGVPKKLFLLPLSAKEQLPPKTLEGCLTLGEELVAFQPQAALLLVPSFHPEDKNIRLYPSIYSASPPVSVLDRLTKRIEALGNEGGVSLEISSLPLEETRLGTADGLPLALLWESPPSIPMMAAELPLIAPELLYCFGMLLCEATEKEGIKAAFLAASEEPAEGAAPCILKNNDFRRLLSSKEYETAISGAAEEPCLFLSFMVLAGVLNGYDYKHRIYSCEAKNGRRFTIASLSSGGRDLSRDLAAFMDFKRSSILSATRKAEDPYVSLARLALETHVKKGKQIDVPDYLPDKLLNTTAGVFVTLTSQGGLRGSMGSAAPMESCLAADIIRNAIAAGTRDPRFDPVKSHELEDLSYTVDILEPPQALQQVDELKGARYGVIAQSGLKKGILLPDLGEPPAPSKLVSDALRLAGIQNGDPYRLERFEVIRHS